MGSDATVGYHHVQEIIFKMNLLVNFNALMMGLDFKNDLYAVTLNLSLRQNVDLIIFFILCNLYRTPSAMRQVNQHTAEIRQIKVFLSQIV